MALGKRNKRPPPLRNQAVQTVGRPYFVVGMLGMTVAGILGILTIALGSTHGMFKFDLDRCDCLVTSSIESHRDAGTSCVYGEDFFGVNIGWKSFEIEDAVSTDGCLDGWEETVDIGTPFGDGVYKKKTKTYGNGATGAADACVWLFTLSAVLAIIAYKTIKMSYTGPGSIYSIGLHNIAGMCLLLSIASAISVTAFWGRIQGRLGSLNSSVAFTLYNATIDACASDWDKVRSGTFCDAEPWEFEVPLFAGMMGIAHVAVMFLTSVWILSKSAFVEGLLDGSVLTSGKAVTPRLVEYEQAVGRALATTEDPDYDADNMLYTGEQNIMIRPYPLPSTVKHKVVKSGEPLVSPLRQMSPRAGGQSGFSKRTPDKAGKSPSTNTLRGFSTGDETSTDRSRSTQGSIMSPLASPGPVAPVPKTSSASKAEAKAAAKAAKKAAKREKKKAEANSRTVMPSASSQAGNTSSGGNGKSTAPKVNSGEVEAGNEQSLEGLDLDDEEESSSVINLSEQDSAGPGDGKGAGRHEKKRSEIDWSSIMAPGGGKGDDESAGGATDPSRFSGLLGNLDIIDQLPSQRDGLGLGAITEDPREDMMSEFTLTPRTRDFTNRFEV